MTDQESKKSSIRGKFLIVVILLIVAALAGFIPMYVKSQRLETQLAEVRQQLERRTTELRHTEEQLELARLHNELGRMVMEVEQKNYEQAKKQSTQFFDRLRDLLYRLEDEELRDPLQAILSRRDEITSDLTLLNPEVAGKLRKLYLDFPSITGGSEK
ncbi:MAG: hypothetical protein D6723_02340 [Acidobacteria bacterium]|nr:MAG: hypothetical protein D6723_02340 [Acidobacteriota bacterium]